MQPKGYITSYSNIVTLDTPFVLYDTTFISSYIYVGTAGDIVWLNSNGELNFLNNAQVGYHLLAATQIVTGGTIGGSPQTTSAGEMSWLASNFP